MDRIKETNCTVSAYHLWTIMLTVKVKIPEVPPRPIHCERWHFKTFMRADWKELYFVSYKIEQGQTGDGTTKLCCGSDPTNQISTVHGIKLYTS